MKSRSAIINLCFCILFVIPSFVYGWSGHGSYGYSGLFATPSAYILNDGEGAVGITRLPKIKNVPLGNKPRNVYFTAVGYLPFIEGSFAFVNPDNHPYGIGDRTVSARIRFLKERRALPALTIGFQDFFAAKKLDIEISDAQHFAATYLVGSKSFNVNFLPAAKNIFLHAGYGVDIVESNEQHLVGFFGGIDFRPLQEISVIAEYDTRYFNMGFKFHLFSHLEIMYMWWDMQHLSWQVGGHFPLGVMRAD